MSETPLQKRIILMASQLGHRLFRHNVCMAWAGKAIRFSKEAKITVYPGDVLVRKAYPIHAGLTEGGSDLIGWHGITGKFIAIETKTIDGKTDKDRLEKQENFILQVNKAGGIAGIIRTEEEGFDLLC